jgi:hypothetical protein
MLAAFRRGLNAASAPILGRSRAAGKTLILFYNTMWDQSVEIDDVPAGWLPAHHRPAPLP